MALKIDFRMPSELSKEVNPQPTRNCQPAADTNTEDKTVSPKAKPQPTKKVPKAPRDTYTSTMEKELLSYVKDISFHSEELIGEKLTVADVIENAVGSLVKRIMIEKNGIPMIPEGKSLKRGRPKKTAPSVLENAEEITETEQELVTV